MLRASRGLVIDGEYCTSACVLCWPIPKHVRPAAGAASRARSADVTMTAPAPSVSGQQSSRWNGLGDHLRSLVVGDGDRLAHRRVGVERSVLAAGDGDRAELLARRAVLVHVPAGRHRVGDRRADEAEGPLEVFNPVRKPAALGRRARRLRVAVDAQHHRARPASSAATALSTIETDDAPPRPTSLM